MWRQSTVAKWKDARREDASRFCSSKVFTLIKQLKEPITVKLTKDTFNIKLSTSRQTLYRGGFMFAHVFLAKTYLQSLISSQCKKPLVEGKLAATSRKRLNCIWHISHKSIENSHWTSFHFSKNKFTHLPSRSIYFLSFSDFLQNLIKNL